MNLELVISECQGTKVFLLFTGLSACACQMVHHKHTLVTKHFMKAYSHIDIYTVK